jgi:uncharacterized membrane protein
MNGYLWVKLLHILSATVLFGTGMGTAFFMLRAYLSRNNEAIAVTTRNVVLADWLFTTPAVSVQLATGLWLTTRLGIAFDSAWFIAVISLFLLVGACWIPVVWIQIRIRNLIAAGAARESYRKLMQSWVLLGALAFSSVILLFYLMVFKPGAYA